MHHAIHIDAAASAVADALATEAGVRGWWTSTAEADAELYDECDTGWERFLLSISRLAKTGTGDPVD